MLPLCPPFARRSGALQPLLSFPLLHRGFYPLANRFQEDLGIPPLSRLVLRTLRRSPAVRRLPVRLRLLAHLPAAPAHRHPYGLSSEGSASRVERRREAHRRIRRGAPRLRAPEGHSRTRQVRDPRGRRRRLLRAPRRGDHGDSARGRHERSPRAPRPGGLDHHATGRAKLLPHDRPHVHAQAL